MNFISRIVVFLICFVSIIFSATIAYAKNFDVQVEVREYQVTKENNNKIVERKIDAIDVYSLAKDAKKLYRGHMLSWELLQKYSSKSDLSDLKDIIKIIAQNYDFNEFLIAAIIKVESGFNKYATSHVGAQGLMQLMPRTADELNVKDPYDPMENISAGTRYIKSLLLEFDNNLDLALAAYNAGKNNVRKYKGIPPFAETINFVNSVKEFYNFYQNNGY